MEFILVHYKALIAVIGSLTGLLGIGLTFYSKQQDSKLKLIEMEFKSDQFNKDNKHQISKEKYQELFSKKIELYELLIKEKMEYTKTTSEDIIFDLQDYPEVVFYDFFIKIRKIIDSNRLFLSKDLSNKYNLLYNKIQPSLKALDLDEINADINNIDSTPFKEKRYADIVLSTAEEFESFLIQIDNDVELIRKQLEV